MKFILTNKESGVFNEENPISSDDLFEIENFYPPRKQGLFPVTVGDATVSWELAPVKKLKEIIVQKKEQLLGELESDILYVIDGDISLVEGETITVPEGGLNIMGYSFDASRLGSYGVPNFTMFSSSEGGSGNLILHNIALTVTGEGSKVFDLVDSNGSHAIEMVTVNFEGCKSVGEISDYRQGTGITIGFYGCTEGLTLSGNWNGFKLTNTNGFGFADGATMFKEGTNLSFRNRFYLEINVNMPVGGVICDFRPSNFLEKELLQVNTTLASLNGVIDAVANTPIFFPNITPRDTATLFIDNIGVVNSFTTPYGIDSKLMVTAVDDIDAKSKGLNTGEVYIDSNTGYLKVVDTGTGGDTEFSSSDDSLLINNEINDIKINVEGWNLAGDFDTLTPDITVT